jgi:tetratricopeptide (TPR) repeat protein
VKTYEDAIESVPSGAAGAERLNGLSQLLTLRLPASAWRIDDEIVRRRGTDPTVLTRRAAAIWSDLSASAPWCLSTCGTEGLRLARQLEEVSSTTCDGYLLAARVHKVQGDMNQAILALRRAEDRGADSDECLNDLARMAIATGDDDEASHSIERLAERPCPSSDECAAQLVAAAELEQLRNSPNRAIIYLRRATLLAPTRDDAMLARARSAAALGLQAEAVQSYQVLLAKHPANPAYRDALAHLQK